MQITIHAEIEGGEKQEVYEGSSPNDAKSFINDLGDIKILQVNMSGENQHGEATGMARVAKGDDAQALADDTVSWLEENGADKDESSDKDSEDVKDDQSGQV